MASAADVRTLLEELYERAEKAYEAKGLATLRGPLSDELLEKVESLGKINHAGRGVALTLFAYKAVEPAQDIRAHMTEQAGGFNARGIDTEATVPFLVTHSLPYRVESHWMTRVFANVGEFRPGMTIKTQPKAAGSLVAETVDEVERLGAAEAEAAAAVLLAELIQERNRGRVELSRPKLLSIEQIVWLLDSHFSTRYEKGAPRLPQLAIYAMYECLLPTMGRYVGCELAPLLRMKAADRKAKTVGDVVVLENGLPFEGVEVKHGVPVATTHMAEAIAKLKTAEVKRYFILSTAGASEADGEEVSRLATEFRRANGCEIIVDEVLSFIEHALRLLDDPVALVNRYTTLVREDPDLGYEHRIAWNKICSDL